MSVKPKPSPAGLEGEYWNVDTETLSITRFLFVQRGSNTYVTAWGSCFPKECEWDQVRLHVLSREEHEAADVCAFATWGWEPDFTHCLFTLRKDELSVVDIALRTDIQSYKQTLSFQKDAGRSKAALKADPLLKFRQLWDPAQPGWSLVQYDKPVYLVELSFDETGPSRQQMPGVQAVVALLDGAREVRTWQQLRGCTGMPFSEPLGCTSLEEVMRLARSSKLAVLVTTIEPDDYLALGPEKKHYNWSCLHGYRKQVVERMLKLGRPVVKRHLE